jgi:hypothetical protein
VSTPVFTATSGAGTEPASEDWPRCRASRSGPESGASSGSGWLRQAVCFLLGRPDPRSSLRHPPGVAAWPHLARRASRCVPSGELGAPAHRIPSPASRGRGGYLDRTLAPIALVELTCAVPYAIPRTGVLGAVLVSGHPGGAVATHVRVGDSFVIPPSATLAAARRRRSPFPAAGPIARLATFKRDIICVVQLTAVKRRVIHRCDRCKTPLFRYSALDAWWCSRCDTWAESTCGDASCAVCADRPARPSMILMPRRA